MEIGYRLRESSLDQVHYLYTEGRITQDEWEAYAHAWRTGAVRYGSELVGYTDHPADPIVSALATELGCCRVPAVDEDPCPSGYGCGAAHRSWQRCP